MITFQSVTKRFGEGQPALEDVSFHVNPGEFLFLTGHSGSGKTTLLKLLTKEYSPTEGEVEFQGKPLSKMRGSQIHHHRRSIGVVFQDYRLLSDLNVWENIALALQIAGKKEAEIEERVTDLLELVQLTDKAYHFPNQLSGGESQRIGIARALATAPSVLLADEPTGNLDPQNTLTIARLFDRINQLGTTILFATHDTSVLDALPHRRLVLEKGKLLSDTPSTAKTASHSKAAHPAKENIKPVAPTTVVAATETVSPKKTAFQFPKLSNPFAKKKKVEETESKIQTEMPKEEKKVISHPQKEAKATAKVENVDVETLQEWVDKKKDKS
jgi:cell division transport system ATP-binding protein